MLNNYNHREREKFWQEYWRKNQIYKFRDDLPKSQTFVIDTPPPTVSGVLHMGHVFSYTQADFIARFKRMRGFDVFYPIGFDDNGLPTERLVEKIIGERARNYEQKNGEGAFVKKCHEVVEEAEKEFELFFNSIALSFDWDEKYQTISKEVEAISQSSFLDLYRKGLIERKAEPVLWDPADQTALAQADLVDKEMPSAMNEIEFEAEGAGKFLIATTRPELLAACVAVMVNPEDARFKKLIGKTAKVALYDFKVPIIADELVQLDKGTGAVMCCTFGDETDIKWWKIHQLPLKIILNKDGRIREDIEFVGGLKINPAREKVIAVLKERDLLKKSDPIKHQVKCAERSGSAIEILVTPQWFIKVLEHKEALKAKAEECNWYPNYMKQRLLQWIDGLNWDWCISRQRFFGVPFPIWYSRRRGEEGKILVAEKLPCDPRVDLPAGYSRDEVEVGIEVMDTWATSSITPQICAGGIAPNNARFNKIFPSDLRPQAHEIIRTWAFYTIVKSHFHSNSIPWKNLMISGWCLAADKTKMSKSKGNVVTPTGLIEEKGSDVVRYFASGSALGADTAFSEEVFKIGQRLATKLFNAAKFASLSLTEEAIINPESAKKDADAKKIFYPADLWILSKLARVVELATAELERFEYAKAREIIEEFFWRDFCDNYLEVSKVRTYGLKAEKLKDAQLNEADQARISAAQQSAAHTIYHCLKTLLKLFAPFIPHLTEELYSELFSAEFGQIRSIHARGTWPKQQDQLFDQKFLELGDELISILAEVRKYKSERKLSMKVPVKRITLELNCKSVPVELIEDFENVCNCEVVEVLPAEVSALKSIELINE